MGQLGLKSVRSIDIDEIKKYVHWLCVLAAFSVLMRIIWVFDIMFEVKEAVKKAQNQPTLSPSTKTEGAQTPPIDGKIVQTFAVQVSVCHFPTLGL